MNTIFDDEFDALAAMVANGSKTAKEVGAFLFPHLKPESAHARFRACLNPEKDERLTLGQVIAAMKFCGNFSPLMYCCDETLHARPDRKTTGDEAVRLSEVIDGATSTLNTALKRLALLQEAQAAATPAIRAVQR